MGWDMVAVRDPHATVAHKNLSQKSTNVAVTRLHRHSQLIRPMQASSSSLPSRKEFQGGGDIAIGRFERRLVRGHVEKAHRIERFHLLHVRACG